MEESVAPLLKPLHSQLNFETSAVLILNEVPMGKRLSDIPRTLYGGSHLPFGDTSGSHHLCEYALALRCDTPRLRRIDTHDVAILFLKTANWGVITNDITVDGDKILIRPALIILFGDMFDEN